LLISDCYKLGFLYVERGLIVGTMLVFCGSFFLTVNMKEKLEWGLELSTEREGFPRDTLSYPQDREGK